MEQRRGQRGPAAASAPARRRERTGRASDTIAPSAVAGPPRPRPAARRERDDTHHPRRGGRLRAPLLPFAPFVPGMARILPSHTRLAGCCYPPRTRGWGTSDPRWRNKQGENRPVRKRAVYVVLCTSGRAPAARRRGGGRRRRAHAAARRRGEASFAIIVHAHGAHPGTPTGRHGYRRICYALPGRGACDGGVVAE